MFAVFRHEVSSYFTSVMSYIFGGFLLLFAGIYTMVYNLDAHLTNFEYVITGMSFVFLIIVPILTMKVLAEERRQRTDQLLYSLPISMAKVVMGKYLAMLVMFLIPLAIICIYPLMLTEYGNVYLPASFGNIIAFFFLGAALIAIGMFISSITDSQGVAAGVCFVVMLLNYFLTDLVSYLPTSSFSSMVALTILIIVFGLIIYFMTKNFTITAVVTIALEGFTCIAYINNSASFEGKFAEIVEKLSLFDRFYVFVNGVFDITSIVYFITVIVVFIFLSIQSLEKRRWS